MPGRRRIISFYSRISRYKTCARSNQVSLRSSKARGGIAGEDRNNALGIRGETSRTVAGVVPVQAGDPCNHVGILSQDHLAKLSSSEDATIGAPGIATRGSWPYYILL